MANGKQSTAIPEGSRTANNSSGSDIPAGTLVALVATGHREVEAVDAITDVVYGVAVEDIADGERGLVYIRGTALVLANAAVTVGGLVTAHTNGRVVDAASGGRIVGIALEAGAAGELVEVELAGPGASLAP